MTTSLQHHGREDQRQACQGKFDACPGTSQSECEGCIRSLRERACGRSDK